jgi:hypothetical protein
LLVVEAVLLVVEAMLIVVEAMLLVVDGTSDRQSVNTDPITPAAVAFTAARHDEHADPNCIKVGQRHRSFAQEVAADSIISH